MKFLFIILLTLVIFAESHSQYVWNTKITNTTENLNSITFINSTTGFACCNSGVIIKTTNKGDTWTRLNTVYNSNMNSILFHQSLNVLCAVGNNGVITISRDQGNTWQYTVNNIFENLNDLSWDGSQTFCVGDNGTFLKSTNGGLNWINIVPPTSGNINSKVADFICGDNGLLMRQGPVGVWTQIPANTSENLLSVIQDHSRGIYICGTSGTILKVTDNIVTRLNTVVTEDLKDIFLVKSGNFSFKYCVGNSGTLIRSWYADSLWEQISLSVSNNINSIFMIDKYTGCIAGNSGQILKTSNRDFFGIEINGNNISTWYQQTGVFNRKNNGQDGFEWPKNSNMYSRYLSGLVIGAVVNNDTLVDCNYTHTEFLPGYTKNDFRPEGKDDAAYRIYKLTHGINDIDRVKWPNSLLQNSDQGAPVILNGSTGLYEPVDYGNQTMFMRMTDSYPEPHTNQCGASLPLMADIKLINYSFDSREDLKNVLYSHYEIINRSPDLWENTYFAFYTNDDASEYVGKVGCDTLLDVGYSYSWNNNNPVYGSNPPAVGFKFIRGANEYTGDQEDTLKLYTGRNKYSKTGYKAKGMYSYNHFQDDGPGDPNDTYRSMSGLRYHYFGPIRNPQGEITRFYYSGDPESATGWNMHPLEAGYRSTITTTGPVNVNPGDTQHIVVAQVIAQGSNYLNSVTKLKEASEIAQQYYDNLFENVPVGIQNENDIIPNEYSLDQNYPNPFNSSTVIKFSLPKKNHVNLKIYDILGREVYKLVDSELDAGNYKYNFQSSSVNNASGIFFIVMKTVEFQQSRKMILLK
ncbi:MAG: T9SS type A sorting domain-containing protein [Ignavibacteria bacterium]